MFGSMYRKVCSDHQSFVLLTRLLNRYLNCPEGISRLNDKIMNNILVVRIYFYYLVTKRPFSNMKPKKYFLGINQPTYDSSANGSTALCDKIIYQVH